MVDGELAEPKLPLVPGHEIVGTVEAVGTGCSLVKAGDRIGFYGFGAAAHLLAQFAVAQGREVYAFTRKGDVQAQVFARSLGCAWADNSDEPPPHALDAALIFAPAGELVPTALAHVRPGGTVVCAGIHMSDIPSFPYRLLWKERCVRSVANLTRADGVAFFKVIADIRMETHITTYSLAEANEALAELRSGKLVGAAVLRISRSQKLKAGNR